MNKREFMQQAWIHITKRLPSNADDEFVLVYNSQNGFMAVWLADMAYEYANKCLDADFENLSWDRQFTHWMPLYEPENCISWAKYQKAYKPKTKKRKL